MHMTSTTVPGAAVAPGARYPRRLQEFFYKMGKDQSRLLTQGLSRLRITNMSSASISEEPGSRDDRFRCHLQEFFLYIEEISIKTFHSAVFEVSNHEYDIGR